MADYLSYTKILGDINSKYFDFKNSLWVCDAISAQKIQDELNNLSIGSTMKLSPYNYQRQAIAYCLANTNALLKLPCGAGKTPIGLGIFNELIKSQRLNPPGIYIVKAALKIQWEKEVDKFVDYRAKIINTYKSVTASIKGKIKRRENNVKKLLKESAINNRDGLIQLKSEIEKLQGEAETLFLEEFNTNKYDIFIINYETLSDEKVRQALHVIKPNFFYIDEVDCIKDPGTKRSQFLGEFKYAENKYGATATPIRKNPKDLFGMFSFLVPSLFPNEKDFDERYLKKYFGRITGSKNEDELAEKIKPYMFVRTFEQIADQLPQQVVIQQYCNLAPKQQAMTNRIMEEMDAFKGQEEALCRRFSPQQLKDNAEYKRIEGNIVARQTFAQMLANSEELLLASNSDMAKAYVTDSPSSKVELCMELVEKIVSSEEKVCIFSKYIGIQTIISREIDKLKASSSEFENIEYAKIYGSMSDVERDRVISHYNATDNCRVLLLSDAGEAGLNLSTTKYMIEFELAESAAKQTQRHGRIQRADSIHKNVFVYQLIANGSYDEIAQLIVSKKQKYAETILS